MKINTLKWAALAFRMTIYFNKFEMVNTAVDFLLMDVYLWRRFGLSYRRTLVLIGKKVADIFIQFIGISQVFLIKFKT
jgi:hypothetical protein